MTSDQLAIDISPAARDSFEGNHSPLENAEFSEKAYS